MGSLVSGSFYFLESGSFRFTFSDSRSISSFQKLPIVAFEIVLRKFPLPRFKKLPLHLSRFYKPLKLLGGPMPASSSLVYIESSRLLLVTLFNTNCTYSWSINTISCSYYFEWYFDSSKEFSYYLSYSRYAWRKPLNLASCSLLVLLSATCHPQSAHYHNSPTTESGQRAPP